MLFICYPKCSTCKKARKWLDDHGFRYESRDISIDNPSLVELEKWFTASCLPLNRLFNTSGMLYRSLGLKDRLPAMTDEEKLTLLATDGMLVKRPILIKPGAVLFGFREDEWKSALLD